MDKNLALLRISLEKDVMGMKDSQEKKTKNNDTYNKSNKIIYWTLSISYCLVLFR
jgi:hypothetical protein